MAENPLAQSPVQDRAAKQRALRWLALALGVVILVAVVAMLILRSRRPAPIRVAFANSLTGVAASAGTESLIGTRLYIDEVNQKGGIDGHPVELVLFDDASSPDTARANAQKIASSDCIAVLGHFLSSTSLAAGPVYKAGHIPAITGTSLVDQLTLGNPYYFRAQTTVSNMGRSTADYIREVWHEPVVELIATDDKFGEDYREGFVRGYEGAPLNISALHVAPDQRHLSGEAAVNDIANNPRAGVVVIGSSSEYIVDLLKGLRRRGVRLPVVATAAAGRDEFAKPLASEPEEIVRPGYFTENFYASVPVIFDSTGASAQVFAEEFEKSSGRHPGWPGAGANSAARLLVSALQHSQAGYSSKTLAKDRERVRLALEDINTPQQAVAGVNGPLFFDAHHDMPGAIRMGYVHMGRFVTAPVQLVPVEQAELIDFEKEHQAGHIVTLQGLEYWLQRVVYTGIDINRLSRVDQRQGTFGVDFYLWMRYAGNDDAPAHVEFPRLVDKGGFNPSHPLTSERQNDLNYRLYRVAGDFKANYDLHQYPFDVQQLLVRFQNTEQRRELVAYVIDNFGLKLASEQQDEHRSKAYADLQLWRFLGQRYFVDWFSVDSTLGLPAYYTSPVRTEYAAFNTVMLVRRKYQVFMFKTLLPLFLLVLVVFATMFFSPSLLKEQVTIPVTGILTSAVLLIATGNQLPEIGYTVAIERVFYIFFALCLITMVSAFLQDRLRTAGNQELALTLNHGGKIVYVLTVVVTIVSYWFLFLRD